MIKQMNLQGMVK